MKIAIVFDSLTGNTKKIAEAIKEVCPQDELIYFGNPAQITDIDLIFIGTWVDKGTCSKKIQDFITTLTNKKIAFFATAGFGQSTEYFDNLAKRFDSLVSEDNEIIDHFFCQGKMPLAVKERYVKMIQEHPEDKKLQVSLDNFNNALSHPDDLDIANAKDFALNILNNL